MTKKNKALAFLLLFVGLVALNYIAAKLPLQADLTDEDIYTLSPGTESLLDKVEDPITLKLYFSRSAENVPTFLKNYASRVEDLLRQYEAEAGNMIDLRVIDPEPDTPEEEAALREGISPQPMPSGQNFFFGMVAIQAGEEQAIPLFQPQREEFLEFDISQLLYQVQALELPRLGVISGLDVIAPEIPPMMRQQMPQQPENWILIDQLRSYFQIGEITGGEIPDEVDVLAVIHPLNLSRELLYEIDQFVLSGKPAFIAVDPSSLHAKQGMSQQMLMMGQGETLSSDLADLFAAWGVRYDPMKVVGDQNYALTVGAGPGGQGVRFPIWMSITEFESEHPTTTQLRELIFAESGFLSVDDAAEAAFQPLVTTTDDSGTVPATFINFSRPDQIASRLTPEEGRADYTLAGVLTGKLKTAFPDGRPEPETDEEGETEDDAPLPEPPPAPTLQESAGTSTVIIAADTDFLSERFSVRRINFLGSAGMMPLNDNLAFASNIFDFLAGSQDLISLRGKGGTNRPFTLVQEIEREAQEEYQERLDQLEAELAEVREKLSELQSQQADQRQLVATPEVLETIEQFREQEADMRQERREIRRKLREDIEQLDLQLAFANIAMMPIVVVIFGIGFFVHRANRRKGKQ